MGTGFDKLMKALKFERARSQHSVPRAKRVDMLLSEDPPFFESRNGAKIRVDPRDLSRILNILGEHQIPQLSLPIYIKTAPSMGHGFHQLLGVDTGSKMEELHRKIVFDILDSEPRDYLYSYEVQRLKRKIPSIIHVFY